MTVTINPQLQRFIDEQVKAGRFTSPDEAMEAGIARLMLDAEPGTLDEQDRTDIRLSLEEMRQGQVIDAKDLHAQIRARHLSK